MRAVLLVGFLVITAISCRTRSWDDEAGVPLTAEPGHSAKAVEEVAEGGYFHLGCLPSNSAVNDGVERRYIFDVKGAVNPNDEAQLLQLDVRRVLADGSAEFVAEKATGRGAVAVGRSVFIGFKGGALTTAQVEGEDYQRGMLTIAAEVNADGLEVDCRIQ
jgi:hypothetical protein